MPAGDTFHDRIREEIGERQLFLFLASRSSLAPGSYCLTELKFCRERWPHPRRHVLTVLLDQLTPEELPPYLSAVQVLRAEGNLVETAGAVASIAQQRKRRLVIAGALVLAVTVLALASIWRAGPWRDAFPNARPLPADIRHRLRAVAVEQDGEELFVAAAEPCELARLRSQGLETLLVADGEPCAIAVGSGYAVLVTTGEPALHAFQLLENTPLPALEIPAMETAFEKEGLPISREVREIFLWDGWITVLTGHAGETAGFFGIHPETNDVGRPLFLEDLVDMTDLRVRALDDQLWGVRSEAAPSSVYVFHDLSVGFYEAWDGKDEPLVSCATDLAEWPGEGFLLLTCEEELAVVRIELGRPELVRTLAALPVPEKGPDRRMDALLSTCGQRALVAITVWQEEPREALYTRVFTWDPWSGLRLSFEEAGQRSRSIATTAERGVVVLEAEDGRFDAYEILF